ncbi:DUF892 family protein [Pedobacter chitinilyticus]|uniref:DUF892 family protein n=1 Tax=Pedobacter chitinilyticus TaxID=2233776 RepID=A0A451GDH6_9SPHI|nr:DUF892 family protein [Pedobacter chitinilyticus]RWU10928.1 DUF892 family protein [Pedobacter chitinilyticus]
MEISPKKIQDFFIEHLDKIHCAKSHLVTKLPALINWAHYPDLKEALDQTLENVKMEISRMDIIYALLDAGYSDCSTKGLIGLVSDAFEAIQKQDSEPELRDLSILFYLQNIESVEMASFQILQMTAVKLKNKQIGELLRENYEQSKSNRTQLLLVATKYITSVSK